MRSFAPTLLAGLLTTWSLSAQSQALIADNSAPTTLSASAAPPIRSSGAVVRTEGPTQVRLRGTIKCPEGPLPGAVIHQSGTKTYLVTDAQGNFQLDVPAGSPPIELTCSYVGFQDVVQRVAVKPGTTITMQLKQMTKLPPRDRSGETSWW